MSTKQHRKEEKTMKRLFAVFTVCIMTAMTGLAFPGMSIAASAAHKSVADGSTGMAINLYRELGKNTGNLFFSPLSISSALAMAYAGARGDTAEQMKATLHFTLEEPALNSAFRSLDQKLTETAKKSDQKLTIGNALVLTGGNVSETYRKILTTYYSAEIFRGDLGAVNAWVKRKT
jgi:serpin B